LKESPTSQWLICLGLRIDTEEFKIYIPEEKICKLKIQLNHALTRNKITLKELQSLAGSLACCLKVLYKGNKRNALEILFTQFCGLSYFFDFFYNIIKSGI
jgi:hypothetical protein